MPVVHYTKPQQGYRPFMNPRPLAGLRGLRGMGQALPSNLLTVKYADGTSGFFDPADGTYYDSQGNDVTGYVQNFGGAQIGGPASSQQISAAEGIAPAATGVPATPSPTVTAPQQAGPSTPAGAPTGSKLLYQATWQLSPSHQSAAQILASVLQLLKSSSVGFQVTNASQSGSFLTVSNFGVQIELFVNGPGFAQPNDAGSFVDHAYNTATGLMPVVSSTVVTYVPPGTVAAPAPTGMSPFPSQTGPTGTTSTGGLFSTGSLLLIALGIGAVVLIRNA